MTKYFTTKPDLSIDTLSFFYLEPNTKYKVYCFYEPGTFITIPIDEIKYNPDKYKFDVIILVDGKKVRFSNNIFISTRQINIKKILEE